MLVYSMTGDLEYLINAYDDLVWYFDCKDDLVSLKVARE